MAEAIWYYAQDDREHGPVTAAYIAGMARSGKLRPEDLVWREGMEDWRPARVVKGLFAPKEEGQAGPASDTAVLEAPFPVASSSFEPRPPEAPSRGEGETPLTREGSAGAAIAPEPPPPPPTDTATPRRSAFAAAEFDAGAPSPEMDPARTAEAGQRGVVDEDVSPWSDSFRWAARGAIFLGLLLVVFARGCDSVASRHVLSLEAKARATVEPPSQGNPATEVNADAQEARTIYAAWGFWRELAALIGTVVLTIGAAGAVFAGRDADRWLGVILVAVVALTFLQNAAALVDSLP